MAYNLGTSKDYGCRTIILPDGFNPSAEELGEFTAWAAQVGAVARMDGEVFLVLEIAGEVVVVTAQQLCQIVMAGSVLEGMEAIACGGAE